MSEETMSEANQQPEGGGLIACDLSVFTPEERDKHLALARDLFGAARELRHLPGGYAVRLPEDSATLLQAAEFIANERRCCPFENFAIHVEPYNAAVWLHLTGPEGYRDAAAPDLIQLLDESVAAAAGLR